MSINKSNQIIFIAGFPRSGTTWFSNLINSHSEVIYRHEILGRNYNLFSESLFNAIKYNNQLTDNEYLTAKRVIFKADVATDKPPFFVKKSGLHAFPKIHHLSWLMTKALPFLKPIYNLMFGIAIGTENWKILIKETRSMLNMESILKGLRVSQSVILVRQPKGTIASHLKGQKAGKMALITDEFKKQWFDNHSEVDYIKQLNYDEKKVISIGAAEFHAIQWRVYHDEMLKIQTNLSNCQVCFYESFVENPMQKTEELFKSIGLDFDQSAKDFILSSTGKSSNKPLINETNDSYYSVYRSSNFESESWKKVLSEEEQHKIDLHCEQVYQDIKTNFITTRGH